MSAVGQMDLGLSAISLMTQTLLEHIKKNLKDISNALLLN